MTRRRLTEKNIEVNFNFISKWSCGSAMAVPINEVRLKFRNAPTSTKKCLT